MTDQAASLLAALVEHLRATGVLTQPEVEAAFRAVPRHLFLPDLPLDEVYRDDAIPTKMQDGRAISSSSQPAMMAIMLEQLQVQPGQRVLEIGAGTGYNAALLGWLVGAAGQVVTVDLDEDIVTAARSHLAAARAQNVQVVHADGGEGYPSQAPYDRIILTVGAWDITPAWLAQLRPGGRLVLPLRVGNDAQKSVAFESSAPGTEPRLISQSVRDCGFMNLRGAFAGPEVFTAIGPEPGLTLITSGPVPASADHVFHWLMAGAPRRGTGLLTTESEIFGSLALWLDLHSANIATLMIAGAPPPPGGWPCLFQFGGSHAGCFTFLLLAPDGMAILEGRDLAARDNAPPAGEPDLFELKVIGYGPEGQKSVDELLALQAGWDGAGRPIGEGLRLRVYDANYPVAPEPGAVLVHKRWTNMVVDWPQ